MNLTHNLHRAMSYKPDALATICGERRRTFAQIGERVARFAGALRAAGVQPGDRVAMLSLNSDRYVEYYMAVPWAGCVVNPVNIRWSANEVAYSLDDCDTRVLIVDDAFAAMVPELRQRSKSLRTVIHAGDQRTPPDMLSYEAMVASGPAVPDAARGGQDLAGVFYTGGTTGFPKGVMLAHSGLSLCGLFYLTEGVVREGTVALNPLPLFHMGGLLLVNASWAVCGTQVLMPVFSPAAMLEAIQRHRVTTATMVPSMIQLLVDHPEVGRFDLGSLETVVYGASPISEVIIDRARRALPGVKFFQIYGMTELSPTITVLRPESHVPEAEGGKARSAGRAAHCVQVRIIDGHDNEVARGQTGEIVVRSPGVMLGYWGKPEASREALRNGWMHTGDVGRMDADGFVFVVDRLKDMIVTGGENVYSAEVEQAVAQHPAVAACAVIGVPDEKWGEGVHAVVVLKAGMEATPEALREHCKALIASYKCPRSVEFVTALPLSAAGKVLKTRLREPHWAGRERSVA